MKYFKRALKILLIILIVIFLLVAGYVIYLSINYYRIEDNQSLTIYNPNTDELTTDQNYSISTYNIGFGAYEQSYSFFMDTGVMLDGTKTKGKYSRALGESNVLTNTNGSIDAIKDLDTDFIMLQEIDTKSTRSYNINQVEMFSNEFVDYSYTFASNFHSSYLPYPFNSPHGIVNSGLMSLSKYQFDSATRISLPISKDLVQKFFDLDRCLSVNRLKVNEHELVLINAHFSAYDEGGVYRLQQRQLLNEILKTEYENGNYVIVGGDFNHDIASSKSLYETSQKTPSWIYDFTDNDLTEGYKIKAANNVPSCRGADIPYIKNNENTLVHTVVVDGFIASDNIEVSEVINIDLDFMYSDHQPVKLTFKLI